VRHGTNDNRSPTPARHDRDPECEPVARGDSDVVCGPGNIAQAHTANEFVEIEQVELATRMYKHMLAAWQHG
jgi:hypothetical protein